MIQDKLKVTELNSQLISPIVSHRQDKPIPIQLWGTFWQDNALTGLVRWLWKGGLNFEESLQQWQKNAVNTLAQVVCWPKTPLQATQTLTSFGKSNTQETRHQAMLCR